MFVLVLSLWAAAPDASAQTVRVAPETATLRQALVADGDVQQPAAPRYDVVALRVAFQPDTTRFTTGDGTFGGDLFGDGLTPNVDPLPHDAAYFEAHLAFLEDYVARVSDGRTTVTTHLLPEVVTVSQEMGAYSPTGFDSDSDAELTKLASLVSEAWRLADEQVAFDLSGFDPATTVFVLFHAGVGRDLELLGTSLDKTPLDLPSLAFDEDALGRLLGAAGTALTFNGFPVDNTLIVPRTETRRGFDFIQDEPFLAEFSINGLLAASFFNALGVPDLFNTATGESAIGPFGLMDALGIFAFNGLFPPEPSAWTKHYLGWADLIEVQPGTFTLPATSLPDANAMVQVRISGAEYFLVENRQRDPEGDGLVLRVRQGGEEVEQRVEVGAEDFSSFDVSGFVGGVVVGVDNYDWALPGGLDEDDDVRNGGILIWHVDERRLAEGLLTNRVNADPERRAIDVEEADGAQDLGFPSNNPLGPSFDVGTPFDFWYEGNPVSVITQRGGTVRLYENRFGPDTTPSSATNEGGASFVVLEGFSTSAPVMTFTYAQDAQAGIEPVQLPVPEDLTGPFEAVDRVGDLLVLTLGAAAPDAVLVHATSGASERVSSLTKPIVLPDGRLLVAQSVQVDGGPRGVALTALAVETAGGELAIEREELTVVSVSGPVQADVAVTGTDPLFAHLLVRSDLDGFATTVRLTDGRVVGPNTSGVRRLATRGDAPIFVGNQEVLISGATAWSGLDLAVLARLGQPVFGEDATGLLGVVPVTSSGELLLLLADGSQRLIDVGTKVERTGRLSGHPVLADLDGDRQLDVLTTYGTTLVAFTQGGAFVDGFPIDLPTTVEAQPLVAALTESGSPTVVLTGMDGYVHALDLGVRGEPVAGFPLAVGAQITGTPLFEDGVLYAAADDGTVKAWRIGGAGTATWGELYGGALSPRFLSIGLDPATLPEGGGLLVEGETYNWPNPIRDGTTHLRVWPREACRLTITIIDGAGALIDRFVVEDAPGGVPSEVRWQTDAPSGLYVARVQAETPDGTSATALIKMAIIR